MDDLPHDPSRDPCGHPTSALYIFRDFDADHFPREVRCLCGELVDEYVEGPRLRWLLIEGTPVYRRHAGRVELERGEPLGAATK